MLSLSKLILSPYRQPLITTIMRSTSTQLTSQQTLTDAQRHATDHQNIQMHPRFHEHEVHPTSIKELEFIRSPFYDVAKLYHLKEGESSQKLVTQIAQKIEMMEPLSTAHRGFGIGKERDAFTNLFDKVHDPKLESIY